MCESESEAGYHHGIAHLDVLFFGEAEPQAIKQIKQAFLGVKWKPKVIPAGCSH